MPSVPEYAFKHMSPQFGDAFLSGEQIMLRSLAAFRKMEYGGGLFDPDDGSINYSDKERFRSSSVDREPGRRQALAQLGIDCGGWQFCDVFGNSTTMHAGNHLAICLSFRASRAVAGSLSEDYEKCYRIESVDAFSQVLERAVSKHVGVLGRHFGEVLYGSASLDELDVLRRIPPAFYKLKMNKPARSMYAIQAECRIVLEVDRPVEELLVSAPDVKGLISDVTVESRLDDDPRDQVWIPVYCGRERGTIAVKSDALQSFRKKHWREDQFWDPLGKISSGRFTGSD